jgi:hypothetical protein
LAAEQGDANAQYYLGIMYDDGEGVLEDDKEAAKWYRLAAEQGHANAQSNLAFRYANGEGVLEDAIAAYAWLNIAGANGHEAASKATDDIQLSQSGIEQAQALSREWVEKIPALLGD